MPLCLDSDHTRSIYHYLSLTGSSFSILKHIKQCASAVLCRHNNAFHDLCVVLLIVVCLAKFLAISHPWTLLDIRQYNSVFFSFCKCPEHLIHLRKPFSFIRETLCVFLLSWTTLNYHGSEDSEWCRYHYLIVQAARYLKVCARLWYKRTAYQEVGLKDVSRWISVCDLRVKKEGAPRVVLSEMRFLHQWISCYVHLPKTKETITAASPASDFSLSLTPSTIRPACSTE